MAEEDTQFIRNDLPAEAGDGDDLVAVEAASGPIVEAASVVLDAAGASQLEIPGGTFLLDADFSREGPDLLLIGEDGTTVLIRDFFATGEPPILVTEGGARVTAELAEALAGPVAPGQYAQAGDAALGEPIGSVETADGGVTATRVDGSTVTLSVGSPVFQGDVLETGGGGAIGIVFVDSSTFSLDENGRMVLDEMVFDPDSGTGTSAFSVVKGVFTFVSGQIAQSGTDAMTVTTPVMSIGIRGTKVAGVAAAEGSDNTVTLLANDDGSVGEISLTNSGGVVLLNVANQTSTITSFNLPPAAPIILPAAAVQNLYGDALNAFQKDLGKQRNTGKVMTMVFSEFGRRVAQNGSAGTDHGTAAPMLLIGDNVQTGLLGDHPSLSNLDEGDLKFNTDFREVYAAILEDWMGADSTAILGKRYRNANVLKG